MGAQAAPGPGAVRGAETSGQRACDGRSMVGRSGLHLYNRTLAPPKNALPHTLHIVTTTSTLTQVSVTTRHTPGDTPTPRSPDTRPQDPRPVTVHVHTRATCSDTHCPLSPATQSTLRKDCKHTGPWPCSKALHALTGSTQATIYVPTDTGEHRAGGGRRDTQPADPHPFCAPFQATQTRPSSGSGGDGRSTP